MSLGASLPLCPDERFQQEPTLARRSGVLFDEDLVLTAGHCFRLDDGCARFTYLFGFDHDNRDLVFGKDQVHGCRRLLASARGWWRAIGWPCSVIPWGCPRRWMLR
jgi:hypothetical protein